MFNFPIHLRAVKEQENEITDEIGGYKLSSNVNYYKEFTNANIRYIDYTDIKPSTQTNILFVSQVKAYTNTFISGICEGSIHLNCTVEVEDTPCWISYYVKVSLIQKHESICDRVMGTYRSDLEVFDVNASQSTSKDWRCNFLMDLDHVYLIDGDRVSLEVEVCSCGRNFKPSSHIRLYHRANEDDTHVTIYGRGCDWI